jgi:limonene 1,2-monooxygenase
MSGRDGANHPLRFGIFYPPYHPTGQNPTLALERNLELAEHADRLGFDEFFFGEHHSGGFELSGCPEVMIAAAAQRTRRIRLGTGVNSLPYHHPLMLADRWIQLDHLTRGRAIFGAGPGALVSDALQMGINPLEQRRRMEEALDAIVALIDGEEPVTRRTDWFELCDARLNLRPYSYPRPDIRVASIVSPSGPRAAGRWGLGLLSMGATSAEGFAALANSWDIVAEQAHEYEQVVDRRRWSVVGPMHIAPTREQAHEDVRFGLLDWFAYFTTAAGSHAPVSATDDLDDAINQMTSSGMGVIGTPDDAIAQVQRLLDQSGGFGSYLIMLHEWADWPATLRSIELVARHVMPYFQGQLERQEEWFAWFRTHRDDIHGHFDAAQAKAFDDHLAARGVPQRS